MELKDIKGIGEKTLLLFNKLSIYTLDDLINYYPRTYDLFEAPVPVKELSEHIYKQQVAIDGIIVKNADMRKTGRITLVTTLIKDTNGMAIKAVWFNMPYIKNAVKTGFHYVFRGHISIKGSDYVIEQPTMYTMADYNQLLMTMQPVYGLTKGLSNKIVTKAVRQAIDEKIAEGSIKEYLPQWIIDEYKLLDYGSAIHTIHYPENLDNYKEAKKRLVFDEFLTFMIGVRRMKDNNETMKNTFIIPNSPKTDEFINSLPYKLTNGQIKAWNDVKENMFSPKLMNRLIQGDVGSGKTIVATLALMNTVYAGFQAAMMVPTEVLARQQFESITRLFEQYGIGIRLTLLIGSMTAKEKRMAHEEIAAGETDIIIGTNAIIQEKVTYNNLGLVITDEQHRFGVNQRESLCNKGLNPHVLVMSATPIPRTLAIMIYGDLDISIINELPSNRLPIKNCVVDTSYRPKAYSFIENEVSKHHQAYVICPMVEESENVEAENVVNYSENMKNAMNPGIRISYLHGKMKAAEKNDIMDRFAKGEIDVLVSTTVIEVGVNVPNATVMMIENAERFGLAQLHQVRGRVGRGDAQSYCIFVRSNDNKKTKERLDILNKSNDGFVIAEQDLKLRGPGDFFGIRQSGDMEFAIGDIYQDADILKDASDCANRILDEDALLDNEDNALLNARVNRYFDSIIL